MEWISPSSDKHIIERKGKEFMPTVLFPRTHYINGKLKTAPQLLAKLLEQLISSSFSPDATPVIVCIGSNRVPGDSLGPLVGTRLSRKKDFLLPVYGTLDFPIHALNLCDAMCTIKEIHPESPVIAIDASLGSRRHLNYITVSSGSLFPGAGVNKNLGAVGDIAITGIINTSGELAQLALQSTRLSTVMNLAEHIAEGILLAAFLYSEKPVESF